jgi:hypothetical protein
MSKIVFFETTVLLVQFVGVLIVTAVLCVGVYGGKLLRVL